MPSAAAEFLFGASSFPLSSMSCDKASALATPRLVQTYGIAFVLLFFAMGGYLPAPATRISSLAATSSAADTVLGQLFQFGTWFLALLMMLPWWPRIQQACFDVPAMVALAILSVLSIAWSQDLGTSLRRSVFLVLGTMFAFYLSRRFSDLELAQIVIICGVAAGVLGMAVSVLLPAYGRDTFNGNAWQGIFRSKNGCAQVMLFLMSPALAFRMPSRTMQHLRHVLMAFSAVLIVMSMAKTAWVLAPAFFLLMSALRKLRQFQRRDALFLLLCGVVCTLLLLGALPSIASFGLEALGKEPSMSGRLPLWGSVLLSIMKKPLLGYGYAAFWTGLRGESLNVFMSTHFEIYQAQNGVLEVWLELGLVGVILVVCTFIAAVRNAVICIQLRHTEAVNWYIGLLVLTFAYNVDETFLMTAHSLPWLLYTVACTGLARESQRARMPGMPHALTDVRSGIQPPNPSQRSFAGGA